MKTLVALSAVVLFATGCANTAMQKDMAELKAMVKQANMNAQDAKAMAIRTDEKLNRVFRKSQMK